MRFMVLVKANADSEAGRMPSTELLTAMGKYNEELVKAGVMVAGEGLHPSSRGARVRFSGAERRLLEGPFPNDGAGLLAGFWIFDVKSRQEAIDWVKRAPMEDGTELEIRQIFDIADFGEAATPEIRAQEARLRAESAARNA